MAYILSIIIPVYNVEKYVYRCIDSILTQVDERVEIIVVDDGSDDNSVKVVQENFSHNKNLKIFNKENGGLSSARNFGLSKATGKYIYYVDSDDYLINIDFIGFINLLAMSKESCYCFDFVKKSNIDNVNNDEISQIKFKKIDVQEYLNKSKSPITNVWKVMLKKSFIDEHNIEFRDKVLCEDIEWYINVLSNLNNISISKTKLYVYNDIRQNSIMNSCNIAILEDLSYNLKYSLEIANGIEEKSIQKKIKKLLFREWYWNNIRCYNKIKDKVETVQNPFNNERNVAIIVIANNINKIIPKAYVLAVLVFFLKVKRIIKS